MAKLTATGVRNAGAAAKSYKLADGGGLYLFVNTKGARYWRYDYRFAGARKTLALGVYPEVSLKDARERHAGAREMLANNLDPSAQKKLQKLHANEESNNTFAAVADEWRERHLAEKSQSYRVRSERILRKISIPPLDSDQSKKSLRSRYFPLYAMSKSARLIWRIERASWLV